MDHQVRRPTGPRFSEFCWSWFGPVRDFQIFVGPGSVRDFVIFLSSGPVRSQALKLFLVLVRSRLLKFSLVLVRFGLRFQFLCAGLVRDLEFYGRSGPSLVRGSLTLVTFFLIVKMIEKK